MFLWTIKSDFFDRMDAIVNDKLTKNFESKTPFRVQYFSPPESRAGSHFFSRVSSASRSTD